MTVDRHGAVRRQYVNSSYRPFKDTNCVGVGWSPSNSLAMFTDVVDRQEAVRQVDAKRTGKGDSGGQAWPLLFDVMCNVYVTREGRVSREPATAPGNTSSTDYAVDWHLGPSSCPPVSQQGYPIAHIDLGGETSLSVLFALNYCLPSTTVCPQLLFALN